jgi:hypothetical protein
LLEKLTMPGTTIEGAGAKALANGPVGNIYRDYFGKEPVVLRERDDLWHVAHKSASPAEELPNARVIQTRVGALPLPLGTTTKTIEIDHNIKR